MHFSDAHIGHRQYNLRLRRDDMYMSFRTTINEGKDEDIDFALFAGDLFHHKKVNARALKDAENALEMFKDNDIPVIVVQGNHDSKLYKEDLTWLEYLHSKGTIILLQGTFMDDGPLFEKHDWDEPGTSSGFVDIGDVRIFGLQYSGQRTSERLNALPDIIRNVNEKYGEPEFTIFMGHFGIEGHIPGISGGISYNNLVPLEDLVDYVALGHLHKNYSHGDWIFNPGSLEAHTTRESTWRLGYYITKISEDGFDSEHRLSKRRPFYRIEFDVNRCKNRDELLRSFEDKVSDEIGGLESVQQRNHHKKRGEKRNPVVDLRLKGLLQFSRSALDIEEFIDIVEEKMEAIKVQLVDSTESIDTEAVLDEFEGGKDDVFDENGQLNRDAVEKAVFKMKAGEDSRYREKKEEVSKILVSVKNELIAEEHEEIIAESLKKKRRELFPTNGGEK